MPSDCSQGHHEGARLFEVIRAEGLPDSSIEWRLLDALDQRLQALAGRDASELTSLDAEVMNLAGSTSPSGKWTARFVVCWQLRSCGRFPALKEWVAKLDGDQSSLPPWEHDNWRMIQNAVRVNEGDAIRPSWDSGQTRPTGPR